MTKVGGETPRIVAQKDVVFDKHGGIRRIDGKPHEEATWYAYKTVDLEQAARMQEGKDPSSINSDKGIEKPFGNPVERKASDLKDPSWWLDRADRDGFLTDKEVKLKEGGFFTNSLTKEDLELLNNKELGKSFRTAILDLKKAKEDYEKIPLFNRLLSYIFNNTARAQRNLITTATENFKTAHQNLFPRLGSE